VVVAVDAVVALRELVELDVELELPHATIPSDSTAAASATPAAGRMKPEAARL
jgi:hypothetical protein